MSRTLTKVDLMYLRNQIVIPVITKFIFYPLWHRSDAYSSSSYSRGIRWLPSPEVCRMFSKPNENIVPSLIRLPQLLNHKVEWSF